MKWLHRCLFYLSISLSLMACGGAWQEQPFTNWDAKSSFIEPFPGKSNRLTAILPDSFLLQVDNDTFYYELRYDDVSNQNLIMNAWGDTLYLGEVKKYKETYFLNHKEKGRKYWIAAIAMQGDSIMGFPHTFAQMHAFDKMEISGDPRLNKIATDSVYTYWAKPEVLYDFYMAIIDTFPKALVIKEIGNFDIYKHRQAEVMPEEEGEMAMEETVSSLEVNNIYPNPASMECTVQLDRVVNGECILRNQSGVAMKTLSVNGSSISFSVNDLKNGTYYLMVTDKESSASVIEKLIVTH